MEPTRKKKKRRKHEHFLVWKAKEGKGAVGKADLSTKLSVIATLHEVGNGS